MIDSESSKTLATALGKSTYPLPLCQARATCQHGSMLAASKSTTAFGAPMRTLSMTCSFFMAAISLSVGVPVAAQARSTSTADSAAVADVIEQFHGALARGDSAGALALLTPDVTILEAGGV